MNPETAVMYVLGHFKQLVFAMALDFEIAQVIVVSVDHCYLGDCKPTLGWLRAQ